MQLGSAFIAIIPQLDLSGEGKLKAAAAASAVAIGGIFAKGLSDALDVGQANDKLRAQLGLSADESKKLGKTAGELFASNYGDSMGQVNDAIKSVIQQIPGISATSGPVLKDVSKGVLDVSRVFDQDFNEVTKAAGQLMKTGLAPDAQSALDLITKGFQGGADKAGDLLDTFNEYGTQFRKLGLDGPQALGLIQQGLKGGARDADVVADAFKEFSIRAIDGSKTTADGFKRIGLDGAKMSAIFAKGGPEAAKGLDEVVKRLNSMTDPVARDAAGVELFGTQWEDLGGAFKSFDVSHATEQLGKVNGATKNLVTQDAKSNIEGFIRAIQAGFVQVLGEKVLPVLIQFGKHIQTHATLYKTLAAILLVLAAAYAATTAAMAIQAAGGFIAFIKAAVTSTKLWAAGQWLLNAAMDANPIGLVVIAIAALVAGIVIAYKNSETFRKIVDKTWAGIKVAIGATVDWILKYVWPGLKAAWDGIATGAVWLWKNALVPAWKGIVVVIQGAWAVIQVIFNIIIATVKVVADIFTWLWKNIIKPVWDGIEVVIKAAWVVLQANFKAGQAAIQALGEVFTWLYKNIIKPTWDFVVAATKAWWSAIQAVFNAIMAFIKGPLAAAWNWIHDTLIKPLWDRVIASTKAWWSAVQAIWNAVFGFIKGTFAATWNFIYDGLIKPMWDRVQASTTAWWSFIQNLWNTVISFIKSTWAAAWNWIHDSLIKPMWDRVQASTTAWWSFITNLWNAVISFIKGTWAAAWNWINDSLIKPMWDRVQASTQAWWNFIQNLWNAVIGFIKGTWASAWNWIIDGLIQPMWNRVQSATQAWWNAIQAIWNAVIGFIRGTFAAAWNFLSDKISQVWNTIKTSISNAWNWIRDNIFNPIQNAIQNTIPNAFNRGADAIGNAWNKIRDLAKIPIRFVLQTVLNDGIIAAVQKLAGFVGIKGPDKVAVPFATGGIYPGYTPGRDIGLAAVSGGEAIMRPEWTKAMGPEFVHGSNRAARNGGINAVRNWVWGWMSKLGGDPSTPSEYYLRHMRRRVVRGSSPAVRGHFANGGIVPFMGNFGLGGIVDAVTAAWNAFTDPIGTLKKAGDALINQIPGAGGIRDLAKGASHKIFDGILQWAKDKIQVKGVAGAQTFLKAQDGKPYIWASAGPKGYDCSGIVSAVWNIMHGKNPYVHTFSTSNEAPYFPQPGTGVFTAGWANPGERGASAGTGHTAGNIGGLAFESTGSRGVHLGASATPVTHFAHVGHAFDRGGWLRPNMLGVNKLGQPEAVLTPDESRGLKAMGTDELIDKLEELIEEVKNIAPGVGDEINGIGKRIITKRRTR